MNRSRVHNEKRKRLLVNPYRPAFEEANEQLAAVVELYAKSHGINFERNEKYLEAQAQHWRSLEGSAADVNRRVDQIVELILRDSLEKDHLFGHPSPAEQINTVARLDKKLLNIRLRVTPHRVALRSIDWMQTCLRTEDATNPIAWASNR